MKSVFKELMSGLDDVESYLTGNTEGFRVHVPETVNVKEIRNHLHMTQARFSNTFGFSLDAVKHWEGGRRTPEPSARAYLTIIERCPEMVIDILTPNATVAQPAYKRHRGGTKKKFSAGLPKTRKAKTAYATA
jgi:putative transcriptional regulator